MVTLGALWLPILVSTILVFFASSLVWMALPHHRSDMKGLADEAAVMEALGKQVLAPGLYNFPHAASHKAMGEPEFQDKMARGPVGILNLWPKGSTTGMGKSMAQWITYSLVLSILVAYVTGRTVSVGAPFLEVFRVAGTVASLAYASAFVPSSIWFRHPWNVTWKNVADGVLYGLLTGAAFGWLFPR
jgi:hypothetical protein